MNSSLRSSCVHVLFLLFAIALFCHAPLHAQIGEQRNNLSIGINGGANLSSVSFIPSFRQATKQGTVFGFTARYISEKYFSMICGAQVEVNYTQYGWVTAQDEGETRSCTRSLNYLEVPFLAHMAFGWDYGFQGFIHAGPQIGILLGESVNMTDDYIQNSSFANYSNGEKAATLDIDHRFDYGITAGAGFEWHTRRFGSFIVEGRYYLGLGDIFNNGATAEFERSAHRNIVIKATYLFDITR